MRADGASLTRKTGRGMEVAARGRVGAGRVRGVSEEDPLTTPTRYLFIEFPFRVTARRLPPASLGTPDALPDASIDSPLGHRPPPALSQLPPLHFQALADPRLPTCNRFAAPALRSCCTAPASMTRGYTAISLRHRNSTFAYAPHIPVSAGTSMRVRGFKVCRTLH